MNRSDFNKGWLFRYAPTEEWANAHEMTEGESVDLPHDFRIGLERTPHTPAGATEGYYPGGIGYYQKTFTVDESTCSKRVMLFFDGVYRMSEVRVGRNLVAAHPGGYTPFLVDLTGRLHPGENTVQVKVNASMLPASRWYPGAGIYRGVLLLTSAIPCVEPMSTFVKTTMATPERAEIQVRAAVYNPRCEDVTLTFVVRDGAGKEVARKSASVADAQAGTPIEIPRPALWNVLEGKLYTLTTAIMLDGAGVSESETRFGVRTIEVDAVHGLRINGRETLLKGGCVHHDNGILGARSYYDSERRKLQKMIDSGYNAIRCAHNPPSTAFLDMCDEMGVCVIDEAFDAWREGKKLNDEHIIFESHWKSVLDSIVLRDRNHPSVVMWSTGNEIAERSGLSDGAMWSKRLAEEIRSLDDTRPLTNGLCFFYEDWIVAEMKAHGEAGVGEKDYWAAKTEDFIEPLDIAGYNYLANRYESDHRIFPERVIAGTESFALAAIEHWESLRDYPYVVGDFVWTAWDYLGESGIGHSRFGGEAARGLMPHPWHIAYCGDIDLCGRKKPQSHYRDFVWSGRKTPYIAVRDPRHGDAEETISDWGWPDVVDSWTFPGFEGQKVKVSVYAAGDEVALVLNGRERERKPCGRKARYMAEFDLMYEPGELVAISFENGSEIARAHLSTAGAPAKLLLIPEPCGAIEGLAFVEIEVADDSGARIKYAESEISVEVTGGRLLAMGSGDPQAQQNYTADNGKAWHGRTMVVVQKTEEKLTLRTSSEGLKGTEIVIE